MSIHINKHRITKTQTKLFNALTKILSPIGLYLEEAVVVGNTVYWVDILSLRNGKVAIEVDGASHTPSREQKDINKTSALRSVGYRVIRVRDKYLQDDNGVMRVALEIANRIR